LNISIFPVKTWGDDLYGLDICNSEIVSGFFGLWEKRYDVKNDWRKKMSRRRSILAFVIAVVLVLSSLCVPVAVDNKAKAAPSFNYGEALQKSIYFYMQQRTGDLPDDNPVTWRADSCLKDGADVGKDLSGGYLDAGDNVKFGLPMASTAATLGWGVYEYEDAFASSGQLDEALDAIRWATDYFIKCHTAPNEFYYQVGSGSSDHAWWGPVEVIEDVMQRPSYKITTSSPGSCVAGATSAALAIASIVFEDSDPSYASTCLTHAKQLFDFGWATQSDAGYTAANGFYDSWSGFWDELSAAAAWLYIKTGDETYLTKAETAANNWGNEGQTGYWGYKWTHSWDDMHYMAQMLLAEITGKQIYIDSVERNLDFWMPGGGITYTPGGLAWLDQWGSLRYAANASLLAFIWSDSSIGTASKKAGYRQFAEKQINYILGDNPRNGSYIIGFGNNSPKHPHHRTAHGSWANSLSEPPETRHTLYGALVGGPNASDSWTDSRGDYVSNEVACDYNAALVGCLAKMYSSYGGAPLSDFPQAYLTQDKAQDKYAEYYANARVTSEQTNFTEISVDLTNHSAWPARSLDRMSYRYFFDASEIINAGHSVSEITVAKNYSEVPVTVSGPTKWSGNIYYITVDYSGSKIFPGGQSESARETQVRIGVPTGVPWDPSNDWSHKGLTNTASKSDYIPVYNAGVLLGGQEPGGTPPSDTTPPAVPAGLTATAVSSSSINLDWADNTDSDLAGYKVYRSTTSGFTPNSANFVKQVTTSAYTDTGLTADTTYYYKVTAVDTSGNESQPSAQASAKTQQGGGTTPPGEYTEIGLPFTHDGAGEYYWKTNKLSTDPNDWSHYINSWNVDLLEINGKDYTNVWVAQHQIAPSSDGYWYIHYKGSASYSHIEVK
jgi:hypothetical protein